MIKRLHMDSKDDNIKLSTMVYGWNESTSIENGDMENVTNATISSGCLADPACLLVRSVEWTTCLVISLVGFTGNAVSVVVLQRQKQRTSNVFLLQCLCSADACLLATTFIMSCIFTWELSNRRGSNQIMKGIVVIFFDLFQFSSNWVLVQLTTDRYIAICKPFFAAKWCTVTRARRCLFGIVIGSILLTLPRAFSFFLQGNFKTLKMSYSVTSTIFRYGIPILVLSLLNTKLVLEIRAARQREIKQLLQGNTGEPLTSSNNAKRKSTKNKDSVTINLIAVVIIFLVCGSCRGIYFILATGFRNIYGRRFGFLIYNVISNILMISNSAVNFMVYCLFYKRFRETSRVMFCANVCNDRMTGGKMMRKDTNLTMISYE